MDIAEVDWKLLRTLKPAALDRFCDGVLREIAEVGADQGKTSHERYLAVFDLIQERNDTLAAAFDGLRRSTALIQLAHMRRLTLITDEEFGRFSPETREAVHRISGLGR